MRYTCTMLINKPIDTVVALWEDQGNFHKWQDGFVSYEQLSGDSGSVGAKARILFRGKMEDIVLMETILVANLPTEKKGLYEHKHMSNTQSTHFFSVSPTQTKCESTVHYVKFNGTMAKLMAILFPKRFKQQSQKWLNQFKVFAEQQ